ncbi:protein rolling stone-like [Culicoides brevitarsis]|uniref:protein rolling stone-like n=1 Tax=Culicoides brevitarsis TaxID=469753 RepID=UPI00307C694E
MPKRGCFKTCAAETSLDNCGFDHHSPDEFVKSQWQDCTKSNIFLLYRWAIAIFFISIVTYSLYAHINIYHHAIGYYFIYLTDIGIILCMLCTLLGAILATIWHFHLADQDMKTSEMPTIFKIYWITHNTSFILSLLITLMYWTVIHTPEKALDLTNFFTHLCNSVFMLIDFVVVAHPVRIMHVAWPLLALVIYGIFTLIYYLAGGVDPEGNPYIYEVIDWSRLDVVLPVMCVIVIFIVFLHTVVFWMYRLRVYIFNKYFTKKLVIAEGQSNLTFQSDSLDNVNVRT